MRASAGAAVALIGACLLASSNPAPPPPAPLQTPAVHRVFVGLEVEYTGLMNGVDGNTYEGGGGRRALLPGESAVAWVSAGSPGRPDDWCQRSLGSHPDPRTKERTLNTAGIIWWAEFRLVSASAEKVVVALDWERWTTQEGGRRTKVAGDRRTVEMPAGETHVIDYYAPAGPGPTCTRNAIIRLSASFMEDPEFESRLFDLDLWLEHRLPDGKTETRRFQNVARQGEEVTFRLAPLRLPSAPGPGAEASLDAILEVEGSIRARLRADGMIDVELEPMRTTAVELRGERRRGGAGSSGRKIFELRPGESVAVPLPSPEGEHGFQLPGGEEVTLKDADLFRGHEDRLILTVTPRI